ncbi:hypothetical protein NC653_004410 [Populus alba x Populus x berolinensis]|uniref:Uncharacterized protein n=1 Tax=Populus alba x Populus x berolinensis TaxID=444605 RepID=A0AAD6WMV4_9ROSI|nr:hypothetical protein NC653_004410 [Populus alba x Populus x berolinensis]
MKSIWFQFYYLNFKHYFPRLYIVNRSMCFFHKTKIEILYFFLLKTNKRISLVKDSIPPI